ncbi:Isoquinoline 1-oxidoreductase subunit [Sorangium cellulosum]|uniref:Isoquinoline 1-oxidoreductase subunit n=1 Tax=Sorangium cellulosum TaxID=56 RepID=A0A150RW83_SORCE|nr:Isoquinoline 1-oxidoreductase subunit [Sorangium cellulosum]
MQPLLLCFLAGVGLLAAACDAPPAEAPRPVHLPPVPPGELRSPEAFASIRDNDARAASLFLEASKVLLHPRCVNCHPHDGVPRQGDSGERHNPPVERGPHDRGIAALECTSCHQAQNLDLARVPGAPGWHLAPVEMAWLGRSPAAICAQVKDPARNGKKTLAQIVEHAAHDELVAWGWAPGHGRTKAPGSQAQFGALVDAWVKAGAACPPEEARP